MVIEHWNALNKWNISSTTISLSNLWSHIIGLIGINFKCLLYSEWLLCTKSHCAHTVIAWTFHCVMRRQGLSEYQFSNDMTLKRNSFFGDMCVWQTAHISAKRDLYEMSRKSNKKLFYFAILGNDMNMNGKLN